MLDESHRGGMVFLGLAREAGDYVGADSGVGQKGMDKLDATGIVFRAIPAAHGGENAVGTGLQRHVKVPGEAIGWSKKFDEILSDVERFDGTDTETLDGSFVQDAAEKVKKLESRSEIAAPRAEIDAAENDFTEAGGAEAAKFLEDELGRKTAAFAADKGNHAEGAAGIAAVLNFQSGAGVIPFPAENGSDEDLGLSENVTVEDWGN